MRLDQNGWIVEASHLPSPHYNERPSGTAIDLLVIHCISLPEGQFGTGYVQDLFLNRLDSRAHPDFQSLRELKVAAHFFIERRGQLTQFVSVADRAWHAGASYFKGREACNDFSIGVELEGSVDTAFEKAQYQTLGLLTQELMRIFPGITVSNIVGHSDIAPGRKQDPGPHFDWGLYQQLLASL